MSIVEATRQRVAVAAEQVYDNPVLAMDFRSRMRKTTAFVVLGAYVMLLAVVMLIAYASTWAMYSSNAYSAQIAYSRNIGSTLFQAIVWTQVVLFSLIVPAVASGSLSREIEKRTMELLALTPLSSGRIVLGKHLACFLYCMALLISSAPLSGICLMFGGISPTEIAITYALLAAWVFLFSSIGVMWSSLFRSTPAAVLFAYGTCFAYFMLTSAAGAVGMQFRHSGGGVPDTFVLSGLNAGMAPMMAVAKARVCGVAVPVALVAFLLHVAIGVLLLLVATTHVWYHRTRRPVAIRLLLVGITLSLVFLVIGNLRNPVGSWSSSDTLNILEVSSAVVIVLFCAIAPFFVTGPIRKPEGQSMLLYVLSPRKLLRDDLGGATSFVLLWAALVYAVFGATFAVTCRVNSLPLDPHFWPWYLRTGAAITAILAGVCSAGVFASSLAQRRAPAAGLVFLFVVAAFALYVPILPYNWGYNQGAKPVFQLAALWPMTPIFAPSSWEHGFPPILWPTASSWLVTGGIYLLGTLAAIGLAGPVLKKTGGVQEEQI